MTTKRVFLFLSILVSLLYLPFLGNAFVSDDIPGIVQQVPTWNFLTSFEWTQFIHISTFLQHCTYLLFGLAPWAFRLVNILFHIGAVWLMYLIGKRMERPTGAFVAALVFAVHPLVTESVTWISGGAYAEYTFWFLLSFWCYLQGKKRYWFAVFFFILSVCTSEKALSLSLLFLVYEWFYGNLKKNWGSLISLLIVNASLIVFYGLQIGTRTQQLTASSYQSLSGYMNPFVQIPVAISSYLQLFVFPVGLTLYHSELQFPWWNFAIRAVVVSLFLGITVYALLKRKPIGFWLCWFVIGLLPTLTPLKIGWVVAERYVYFSLIGVCMVAGIWFDMVLHRKKLFVYSLCVGILLLLGYCTQTVYRNSQWRTEDTLWIATAVTSPSHPPTWNNMGDVYARAGNPEKAAEMFQRAINLNPQYADAYHNLGHTYLRMGKFAEAKQQYKQAIRFNPYLWQSYRDLAVIFYEEHDIEAAKAALSKALQLAPNDETLLKLQKIFR
ncbi:MAG: tetratricopeptide repeat protein [Microgenomates group bacterium]